MSFANPTPLRVGARGAFHGWHVRIAARLVLGVEIDGETYTWQEFYLTSDSGNSGTLVYEVADDGSPEWKLFREFKPVQPLSAQEAALKRVGDQVNLDGTPTRITLVDESRVQHIDGTPPDGVEIGDVAHYFNADTGRRMLVASWTGNEIEFYEGEDVPPALVADAFGLPAKHHVFSGAPTANAFTSESTPAWKTMAKVAIVLLTIAVVGVVVWKASTPDTPRKVVPRAPAAARPAPPPRLATGATGTLGQRRFTVTARAKTEIGRVGMRHGQVEYQLTGDEMPPALLINALTGNTREWHLLLPVRGGRDLERLKPRDAAERRKGTVLEFPDRSFRIVDLLYAQTATLDGPAGAAAWQAGQYGFLAQEADEWLLARWTESRIEFHRGKSVREADVLAAFGSPSEPPVK